jgi:proteasome lid subunit RPN8/RPN11
MRRLELPPELHAQILRAGAAAAPAECCGLIEGVRDGDALRAAALHPARNLSPDAARFEIDPQDHFDALRRARVAGHSIIGCYHSHPGGRPEPSPADLAGAGEEGFLWLIAADAALGAFVYSQGGFAALPAIAPGP